MKILITGGAGFIGQHLARRLYARGDTLVALDILHPQVHLDPDASKLAFPGDVVTGDVADQTAWDQLAEHSFDAVVHLAAETGTGQSMYEVERYHRVNVEGTVRAGEFAAERGVPLVQLSSRAVYGDGTLDHASTEDDPHRPVSVYGETKSLAEQALTVTGLSSPITSIRPQNVVGPGQALHNPYTGVLAAFLARLRENRPLTVYGDGSATRDFVHVADLADLIVWCLDHPGAPAEHRILNCGTGTRTTLLELAEAAIAGARQAGADYARGIEHLDVHRAGDIEHACADLSRLRALGAPAPAHTSRGAIVEFISWSWDKPGAGSQAWDDALAELSTRGMTSGRQPEDHAPATDSTDPGEAR